MATAKTKRTNLVDMVRFLRGQRDAALVLLPEPLHHYLDEQLNVAAWYPAPECRWRIEWPPDPESAQAPTG